VRDARCAPNSAGFGAVKAFVGDAGHRLAASSASRPSAVRINFGSGSQAIEDRGGTTANHHDHVHVSFQAA
jgi:hypothetical protein